MAIRVLLLILFISFSFSIGASAEGPLKAAFIRDHQLWIKEGDKELQLTTGQYVSSPKWSKDGQFIAYLAGKEEGGKTNLYIYDVKKKESYKPYPIIEANEIKWSPTSNQLAYNSRIILCSF